MAVPLYEGDQRSHHLLMSPFRRIPFFTASLLCRIPFFTTDPLSCCQVFPADPFGFCPVTATVSAVKVVSQQLRYSEDGQHDGDVRCALKVL